MIKVNKKQLKNRKKTMKCSICTIYNEGIINYIKIQLMEIKLFDLL